MEQMTLFDREIPQPLAARLRPETLEEYVGQTHLLGPGKVLRRLIESDRISSMIFWGPPGVGKTTLARIIAHRTKSNFIDFSAVTSGIKEIKAVMQEAENNRRFGTRTIVFVDEIHRFNKAQQDAFLPFVEKGSIILIGATTENPSFEINGALLSRCKVFVLKELTVEDLLSLLRRALTDPRGFGSQKIEISDDLLEMIARFANGKTAAHTMTAFSREVYRDIKIYGTKAELYGIMEDKLIEVRPFGGAVYRVAVDTSAATLGGHCGGDYFMMQNIFRTLNGEKAEGITYLDVSIESHIMSFAAERSRLHNGQTEYIQNGEN